MRVISPHLDDAVPSCGALLAALRALDARGPREATLYEDVPCRAIPGLRQDRLVDLRRRGFVASPVPACAPSCPCRDAVDGHARADAKARALACYASRWRAFGAGGLPDAIHPERLWSLARRQECA